MTTERSPEAANLGANESAGGVFDVVPSLGPDTDGGEHPPFQVMPPLSSEEYDALKADIAERGILVPVLVDQDGRVLDGHHRHQIAVELGIDCPTEVRKVADDDEARDLALTLNLARRHLSREQVRELIANEIAVRPDDSDRAISRRLGCSPSTVGAVRRGVSNLDTGEVTVERAQTSVAFVRKAQEIDGPLQEVVSFLDDDGPSIPGSVTIPPNIAAAVVRLNEIDAELQALHEAEMEALAKHRWHWTLDESNPDRVSIQTYARDVGSDEQTIRSHVDGYAAWISTRTPADGEVR